MEEKKEKEKRKMTAFRLPPSTLKKLKSLALKFEMSMSDVIVVLINENYE